MLSTTDSCFASWLEALLRHPSASPFDNYTRQTVIAIKLSTNTEAATNLLKRTQANLAFFTTATGVKHQCLLYHHLEEFGSTILNQQAGHYALLGLGDSAQPVSVNTMVLSDVEDKIVPDVACLKDLDTTDKVNANPPATGPNAVQKTE
mmetsp:Transcript_14108/g.17930  ORF Transcript_14108/g.17930 Transcript_14108/m.17930 type:complete len:149 (+) Transcript_14108:516-962(+)